MHRFASSFRTQSKSARQNDNETVDNMNEPGAGEGGKTVEGGGVAVSLAVFAFQRSSVAFAAI